MIDKAVTILVCLAFTHVDANTGSSVPTVETYPYINNGPGTRRFYPATPAPIYEDPEDTHSQPPCRSQGTLFEVLNTPFVNARSNNIVHIGYTPPYSQRVQNQVLFQPAYSSVTNTNRRLPPVRYITHTHSSQLANENIGPVVATTYGQPAFSPHAVASQAANTITYSEAPVMSHTTFTGHGARFAW